jgi:hypothetical protein
MHSAQDKLLLILAVLTLLDNSLQSATMDPFGRITVLLGKYVYYYYYYYYYKLWASFLPCTSTTKYLGIKPDSKLHFHAHVDYIFSQSVRMLGLVRIITHSFSTLDSLLVLYFTLIRSESKYASAV